MDEEYAEGYEQAEGYAGYEDEGYYEDEPQPPPAPGSGRRWGWVAIALLAGVGFGLWSKRARAKKRVAQSDFYPPPTPHGLTSAGLLSEGFTQSQTERVLIQQHLVNKNARDQKLDPDFINGVIWAESKFVNGLTSLAGANGLMQLMPQTEEYLADLKKIETSNPMNPPYNIELGSFYLRRLIDQFGDETKALAAYNWGPGNVEKHPGAYPDVTVKYIADVKSARDKFKRARQKSAAVA